MKTCSSPPRRHGRAFTLVELLVVIVIIATLAGVAIPVITHSIANAQKLQTQAAMHDLAAAVGNYRQHYNRLPMDPSLLAGSRDEDMPAFQTDGSVDMINILTAQIATGQTPDLNTARIPFLSVHAARNGRYGVVDKSNGDTEGAPLELRDLWGQPYFVLLDTNYDNRVENPDRENGDLVIRRNSKYLSGQVFIYSAGPDKIPLTKDDICSWR